MTKKISILGGGESGVGAALLAHKLGMSAFVSDVGAMKPEYTSTLSSKHIAYEQGVHSYARILDADILIKSPGIPATVDIVTIAKNRGIPVISEIEFAWQYCDGKVIAITGSNGKTTTSSMIHAILDRAGLDVGLCGNIGNSFAATVAKQTHAWYVVEVSSFQLEDIDQFQPYIAVLTNIFENHLNRYDNNMSDYIAAKMNILKNVSANDHVVYCMDNEFLAQALEAIASPARAFGFTLNINEHSQASAWIINNYIMIDIAKKIKTQMKSKGKAQAKPLLPIERLKLHGRHNLYNTMASSIVGRLVEIRKDVIRDSLIEFDNLEHRLESVKTINGVEFINDSKATNVNATWFALESMNKKTILIAGGVDKGNDYTPLLPLAKSKLKALIILGEDTEKLEAAFKGKVPKIVKVETMEEAVMASYSIAEEGETILLSPACASFDMFENYEDRGRAFKDQVTRLIIQENNKYPQ